MWPTYCLLKWKKIGCIVNIAFTSEYCALKSRLSLWRMWKWKLDFCIIFLLKRHTFVKNCNAILEFHFHFHINIIFWIESPIGFHNVDLTFRFNFDVIFLQEKWISQSGQKWLKKIQITFFIRCLLLNVAKCCCLLYYYSVLHFTFGAIVLFHLLGS